MGLRPPRFHELVAELGRKREVGKLISVQMSQLDPAEPELDAFEAM